mgnify:CR=1 FL=1
MNSYLIVQIYITGNYFSTRAWKNADSDDDLPGMENYNWRKIDKLGEDTGRHIRCGQNLPAIHAICCQYEVNIEMDIDIIHICEYKRLVW